MAYIEIVEGFNKGIFLKLEGDTLIGRAPNNALCLPDSRASREHALIKPVNDGYILQDLASANGTMVNGVLLRDAVSKTLDDGDEIIVCSTKMVFHDRQIPLDKKPSENIPAPENGMVFENTRLLSKEDVAAQSHGIIKSAVLDHPDSRLSAIIHLATLAAEAPAEDALLNGLIDCIFSVFPDADRAIILLRDAKVNEMIPAAGRYRHPEQEQADAFYAISRTIIQEVMAKRQAVMAADALEEYGSHSSIADLSIRSMMCAPLITKREILGIVHVDITSSCSQFTSDDLDILTGIAAQAALAVKNAALFSRVNQIASLLGQAKEVDEDAVDSDEPADESDTKKTTHSTDILDEDDDPTMTLKN